MKITKKMLEEEIKVLHKAASLHAKYSISQYKQVLDTLEKLEEEKRLLEKKVKLRTSHLEYEIAQKENLANKLQQLAQYDQLTKLANRHLFISELELIYKEAQLLNKSFSLLFIDLDGFKLINDTYGHEIGDALLIEVAHRIRSIVRKDDMVARLGGDEFTVILKNINKSKKLKQIASMIIRSIKEVFLINNLEIYIGASIGIYSYTQKEKSFQEIISKADIAMYEAKKAGKGRYIFFDEGMQQNLQEHANLKNKIKNGLKEKRFKNFFQPIVSSVDHTIKGAEVLLRFYDNDTIVSPIVFIPILEEDIYLIQEVTFWQIEEVIKLLLEEKRLFFSINISAKLLNFDLIQVLDDLIKRYAFDTSRISFEVTETSLFENISLASKIIHSIKERGFSFSLDDFGTGYSSLAYLKELSFDTLKIDKKFIDDANRSVKNKKLLQSIINMARILEMRVVLEGIETQKQLKLFRKTERIKLQGFYFYKPLELEKFLQVLSKEN